MDQEDPMATPVPQPFYFLTETSNSGSGKPSGLQGSQGIYSLNDPNVSFQLSTGSVLPAKPSVTISPHDINASASVPSALPFGEPVRRKRGRPRKYGPDGMVSLVSAPSLSTNPKTGTSFQKRAKGWPPGSGRKQQSSLLSECLARSAGMGFTPYIITIGIGENIATRKQSFLQQGPRVFCILSANGAVSTAILGQPSVSGGTVTYQGCFEIVCLSGSYPVSSSGSTQNGISGLSVSLASPDGHVFGGGVKGVLIAVTPVQVIVGSFTSDGSNSNKTKKEAPQIAKDSDHHIIDGSVVPCSDPSNLSFIPMS